MIGAVRINKLLDDLGTVCGQLYGPGRPFIFHCQCKTLWALQGAQGHLQTASGRYVTDDLTACVDPGRSHRAKVQAKAKGGSSGRCRWYPLLEGSDLTSDMSEKAPHDIFAAAQAALTLGGARAWCETVQPWLAWDPTVYRLWTMTVEVFKTTNRFHRGTVGGGSAGGGFVINSGTIGNTVISVGGSGVGSNIKPRKGP